MPTLKHTTKGRFETNLVSIDLRNNFLVTLYPLVYRYGPGPTHVHQVPAYKLSDGASAPWIAGAIDLQRSEIRKLGVLHDDVRDQFNSSNMLSDAFLYDAALSIGKTYWQGLILYYAVRLGTWFDYATKMDQSIVDDGKKALSQHLNKELHFINYNSKMNVYEIL